MLPWVALSCRHVWFTLLSLCCACDVVCVQVRVMLTPAQHWSARGVFDRRATLWGGWAVLGQQLRFWFAGDTGYCPVFKEIGERCGPFDLAAIPVGAYE